MKRLSIFTQSVTGGEKKSLISRLVAYKNNQKVLSVDNISVSRDEPIIIIYDESEAPNENIIFEGTQAQLIERLKR